MMENMGYTMFYEIENAVIKNFPLEFFKKNIVSDIEELTKQKKTSLSLKTKGNQNELCAKKDAIDKILKLATRDGSVSGINIREDENLVDFVLPFKSTQKLLK